MILALFLVFTWQDSPETVWERANEAYREGRFQDALQGYESLLAQGIENGKLHFNLGNAYHKAGKLGKAVLHYYKAQKLMPGDPDVANNLAMVSQLRVDPPIDEEFEGVQALFQEWMHRLNYRWVFLTSLVLLCLAGLASLALIIRTQPSRWLAYVMVIGALMGLLTMGAAYLQHAELVRKDHAVVVAREVDVLSGPSTKETVSFTIHEGIRCLILDRTEGWYRIRLANGFNGWLPRSTVETI